MVPSNSTNGIQQIQRLNFQSPNSSQSNLNNTVNNNNNNNNNKKCYNK